MRHHIEASISQVPPRSDASELFITSYRETTPQACRAAAHLAATVAGSCEFEQERAWAIHARDVGAPYLPTAKPKAGHDPLLAALADVEVVLGSSQVVQVPQDTIPCCSRGHSATALVLTLLLSHLIWNSDKFTNVGTVPSKPFRCRLRDQIFPRVTCASDRCPDCEGNLGKPVVKKSRLVTADGRLIDVTVRYPYRYRTSTTLRSSDTLDVLYSYCTEMALRAGKSFGPVVWSGPVILQGTRCLQLAPKPPAQASEWRIGPDWTAKLLPLLYRNVLSRENINTSTVDARGRGLEARGYR